MGAKVLNGKEMSAKIKAELKVMADSMKKRGIVPGLAVIIVGGDPASRIYVNMKRNDCTEIGIDSYEYALDENTSEEEVINLIKSLNNDPKVNGILVQLPLPGHINEDRVICSIDPIKDVDCFHPINVGKLMIGKPEFLPCTPAGVMEMLEQSGIDVAGKECVVVGRSNIVGKPQAMLLLSKHGTVTVCHSRTKNLTEVCKRADILVVAVGRAEFIKADAVKPGAVVIDVGVTRLENKKIVGDVDFEAVSEVASVITPPVGGVGPMTRALLMKNTMKAVTLQNIDKK